MSGHQRKINQAQNIVHGVVVLGDAQRPANDGALGFAIGASQVTNGLRPHPADAFRIFRRIFLDVLAEFREVTGGVLDKLAIFQPEFQDFARYAVRQCDIGPHLQAEPLLGKLGRAGPPGIHDKEPRPTMNSFQHMMEENRMCLPGIRSPENNEIRLFYLAIGTRPATCAKDRRQTDDARSMSSPVAAVDIVAADHRASELLCHEVHFIGRLRATEHPEALWAVLLDRAAKALCGAVQGFVPGCRT